MSQKIFASFEPSSKFLAWIMCSMFWLAFCGTTAGLFRRSMVFVYLCSFLIHLFISFSFSFSFFSPLCFTSDLHIIVASQNKNSVGWFWG